MSELACAPVSFRMLRAKCPHCKGNLIPCDPYYEGGIAMCICCGRRFGARRDLSGSKAQPQNRRIRLPIGT